MPLVEGSPMIAEQSLPEHALPGQRIQIAPDDLAQIVESVFQSMLNLDVSWSELPWVASEDRLTAAVHMAGDWNGAVLLECDRNQACRFAGRFLSSDPPLEVDDVVRDMLGELVNMIGGNLKSVLARGLGLSMPSVVDGSDYSLRFCRAKVHERIALECEEGPFWVTVLTTRPD
jgi:chemotaxis protein CheX